MHYVFSFDLALGQTMIAEQIEGQAELDFSRGYPVISIKMIGIFGGGEEVRAAHGTHLERALWEAATKELDKPEHQGEIDDLRSQWFANGDRRIDPHAEHRHSIREVV